MTGDSEQLRRLPDGKIAAPPRYVEYDGQVIVRERYSTHQRWTTTGSHDSKQGDPPSILHSRYCRDEDEVLKPKNDHLDVNEIEVYYVEDTETVLYEVAEETPQARPDGGFLVPVETWFDADWIDCIECRGNGQRVECMDDLCHAQGRCMHDPVNNVCSLCGGTGEITKELADRWSSRDSFEAVTAPDPDLWRRGKLHAAARERHDREVQDSDNTAGDDRPGAA